MTPWINYHHLFYFKVIAEEGSVSKAAEKLLLGQPTLSAQLKQFESVLGVQLFERHHRKLTLSEQGKVALEYARNIFKLGGEMYEVLQDKLVPTRTHLHLAALDSIPKHITFQLTKAAYKIGNCQVTITEGHPDEILRELSAHRIDLFVTNFIPITQETKTLVHRSVIKKPIAIYAAPKFKKLKQGFPNSLQNQPFVMPTYDSKIRYDLEHWFKTRGLLMDIVAETQDIGLKILMAVEGLGLIPAAAHTVSKEVQSGQLIELGLLTGTSEELFLVTSPRKIVNPVAQQLMKTFNL